MKLVEVSLLFAPINLVFVPALVLLSTVACSADDSKLLKVDIVQTNLTMKEKSSKHRLPRKWWIVGGVVLTIVLVIPGSFLWKVRARSEEQRRFVLEANHGEILTSLRDVMNSDEVRKATASGPEKAIKGLVIDGSDEKFIEVVPKSLIKAGAKYMVVSTNEAIVLLSAIPRMYLIAFKEGSTEYGGERITNGLWFSINPSRHRQAIGSNH